MRVALVTTVLLVLMCISGMNAECRCVPQDYLHFPERGTTDYVIQPNVVANRLSDLSLCLLFRPDPAEPVAPSEYVPFSYAAGQRHGNDIALITSPRIQIILNGYKRDTGVTVTRGYWHQMCFTWRNSDGHWKMLVDGLHDFVQGDGWATGSTVTNGGTLVIGQDQDSIGGGFNAGQAFLGGVSDVNLWDKVLTRDEIRDQFSNCRMDDGSAVSWSDFRNSAEIHGDVVEVSG